MQVLNQSLDIQLPELNRQQTSFYTEINYQAQKQRFIDKYGITMQIPAYYIQTACYWPRDYSYLLIWENHAFPQNLEVFQVNRKGVSEERDWEYESLKRNQKSRMCLLVESKGLGFETMDSIDLEFYGQGQFKFSSPGNLIAIGGKGSQSLFIYDSSDIMQLLSKVQKDQYLQKYDIKDFRHIKKVRFSRNEKVVCVGFDDKILIYDLTLQGYTNYKRCFMLPKGYEKILNSQINENGSDGLVLCKREGYRNVDCLKIADVSFFETLRFSSTKAYKILTKISYDFKTIILVNDGGDNIIYQNGIQDNINWFNVKKIRKISTVSDGFMCISCNDYDKKIEIIHTHNSEFRHEIRRQILPDNVRFSDLRVRENKIKVISIRDEELFSDILDMNSRNITGHYHCYYKNIQFQWPYYGLISAQDDILIFSAFNPNKCYRIQKINESERMMSATISQNLILYYTVFKINQQGEQVIVVYMVNLDQMKVNDIPVFAYRMDQVNFQPIYQLFVRSSSRHSRQELRHYNKNTICLIRHNFELFLWNESKSNNPDYKIEKIVNAFQFRNVDENEIYILNDQKQKILLLKLTFSSYQLTEIYELDNPKACIIQFEVDYEKVYFLQQHKNKSQKIYEFKVLNKSNNEIVRQFQVTDYDFIGRTLCGHFKIIDDIMYYQNSLIKIDLKNGAQGDKCLNHYNEVLPLKEHDEIPYHGAIVCYSFRKLLYFKKNSYNYEPKTSIILPYVNDRKIVFCDRYNITQFCTLVNEEGKDALIYSIVKFHQQPLQNPFEHVYSIYSIRGQLIKEYKYDKIYSKFHHHQCSLGTYGNTVGLSNDGRKLILKTIDSSTIAICKMTMNGMETTRTLNLNEFIKENSQIQQYLQRYNAFSEDCLVDNYKIEYIINDNQDILVCLKQKIPHEGSLHTNLNVNKSEVRMFLSPKNEDYKSKILANYQDKLLQKIFIFIKGNENFNFSLQSHVFSTHDSLKQIVNFTGYKMSNNYVVFWNKTKIFIYSLETRQITKIDFEIDKKESAQYHFKEVYISGDNKKRINIVMQNGENDMAITFNFIKQVEEMSYDVSPDAQIFFDKDQKIYILNHDYVIMNESAARLQCFGLKMEDFAKQYLYFGLDKGHRVDTEGMNHILIRNYLSLGQSYFSMIYIDQLKGKQLVAEDFDLDGFCYIYDQRCELHQFAVSSGELEVILKKYEEIDRRLLDQILIVDSTLKTPLHLAIEHKCHKSVTTILRSMTFNEKTNSFLFRNIFGELLNYEAFIEYMDNFYFQTYQMKSILTLDIQSSSPIFQNVVEEHSTSFMDSKFFDKFTSQNSLLIKHSNQPVIIKGFNVWWILNKPEGDDYFLKLYNKSNLNQFNSEANRILIQYLWKHYSWQIIYFIFIPYIVYFGLFLLFIFYAEDHYYNERMGNVRDNSGILGTSIVLLFFIAYFFIVWFRRLLYMKVLALQVFWNHIDFYSLVLNITVIIMVLSGSVQLKSIRRIEAIASMLMWLKFLYFFRILNRTAPLIRMIQEIIKDMISFIIIYVVCLLAFANGFYILAQNQIEEGIDQDNTPYYTMIGSIRAVYLASIGEFDHEAFNESKDEHYLWSILVLTTVFLLIVLLNMLIAIMSATFSRVADTAQSSIIKERLQLIIENKGVVPQIFNKNKVKYLISIQPIQENSQPEEILDKINEDISSLKNSQSKILSMLENLQKN